MNLEVQEIQQLENWTSKKVGEIVFDSNIHRWSQNDSEFDSKLMNKSNLLFIIEEQQGNKFGGYLNTQITSTNNWHSDSNAFLFTLKSPGRNHGMKKFNMKSGYKAFCLCQQSNSVLLRFGSSGHDLRVDKKNQSGSYCHQYSFNYNGATNVLCGNYNFTPKRITVIQMK